MYIQFMQNKRQFLSFILLTLLLFQKLFPKHPFVQALYDFIALLMLGLVAWLAWRHAAMWQIILAIALFFIALVIAGMNRDRLTTIKGKFSRKN